MDPNNTDFIEALIIKIKSILLAQEISHLARKK